MVNKRARNAVLGCNLKNNRMISIRFQGKPFNITVIQVYAPTSNTEEVEWFYEDLQDLLELTPPKKVRFIIGDWNAKVGSQETPGVTGKFGLGIWNEAGQRLIEFCQENALVITKTLFQQHKRRIPNTTLFFKKLYWFIFGCAESLLLHGLFSGCSEWGLLSSCSLWASHCGGFSFGGAQALGISGSAGAAYGLCSCSSRALEHRFNSCGPQA